MQKELLISLEGAIWSHTLKIEDINVSLFPSGPNKVSTEISVSIEGDLDVHLEIFGLPGTDWVFTVATDKKVVTSGTIGSKKFSTVIGAIPVSKL